MSTPHYSDLEAYRKRPIPLNLDTSIERTPDGLCPYCRGSGNDPGRKSLTLRQWEFLNWIRDYIKLSGISPTYQEIATAFHYRSLATVYEHLQNLVDRGHITIRHNEQRSIRLVTP